MKTTGDGIARLETLSRREAIAAIALTFGSLAAVARVWGETQPAPAEIPGSAENSKRTSIHQDVDFKALPNRVFGLLMDPSQFAAFTGRAAEIDPKEGGAFSLFGGLIVGRNIELIPGQRIVQAWRPTHWDPGIYSIVRFQLLSKGTGTSIVFDHTGFPEGEYDHLLSGWNGHYWGPIAKYLS